MIDIDELFDRFVEHSVTAEEIVQMHPSTIEKHIGELRAANPDDLPLSNAQIAGAIYAYAAVVVEVT